MDPRLEPLIAKGWLGVAPRWIDLNGRWADPGPLYAQRITVRANKIIEHAAGAA
jgi:hypothetical protein